MRTRRLFGFLLQFATLGLAAALVIVLVRPDLLRQPRAVVQLRVAPPTAHPPAGRGTPTPVSFATAVAKAAPAVVNVYSARVVEEPSANPPAPTPGTPGNPRSPMPELQTGLGSGVIFSPQGYILTNEHVIAGASEIEVMLADGRSAQARVVGTDPDTDLAVLKIGLRHLAAITIGDSNHLRVGDVVLAIGNPYGVGQTVTMGIVSATGRKRLGLSTYEDFIQTDAAINPGNSGGALVNSNGDLIGLNTAIFSRSGGSQGIGFAIPAALARHVMTEIIEHGRVIRGWIGISMGNVTPAVAQTNHLTQAHGVLVVRPIDRGPAQRAGLRAGDILLRLNGEKIDNPRQMLDLVARQEPGARVNVEGVRQGRPFQARIRIAERPPAPEPQ